MPRRWWTAIAAGFDDALLAPVDDTRPKDLNRRLRQLKLSRRAIESQFPGALAPGGWRREQIGQLQLALYAAEQGLVQMVDGAASCARRLLRSLAKSAPRLRPACVHLQAALASGSQESLQALAQEGEMLQTQVRQYGAEARSRATWRRIRTAPHLGGRCAAHRERQPPGGPLDRGRSGIGRAGCTPGRRQPRRLPMPMAAAQDRAKQTGCLPVRVLGRFDLHPTTVLGLQAVLATGLAMLLARLLQVDHANWVFWTAFAVIAGSSGESLRKMTMRVLGTVGGVAIGVGLALLTPDDTLLVVAVATACVFLTIYYLPVSYPKMVFWLNIGFVMVYTRLGAQEFDLLINRPYATLLGAVVAAGVVLFVFPIHIGDRFKVAATQFLGAVDGYVAAFVAVKPRRQRRPAA